MYLYQCKYCKKKFEHHKKNKKFCSFKCYSSSRDNSLILICKLCAKEFKVSYRFRDQKFCNQKCLGKYFSITYDNKIKLYCKQCNKDFRVIRSRKNNAKFCSYNCFINNVRGDLGEIIERQCEYCKILFEVEFAKRKRRFCSKSCANSGENNYCYGKTGKEHPLSGISPWIKGKTAKTDPKVASLGKKISKLLKKKFSTGEKSHHGSKNPNYGKTRDQRTPEQLENYSRAASKRIMEGVSGLKVRHETGYYTSIKTGYTMFYRSSYELRVMKILDSWTDVVCYDYEPFSIKYSNGRRYIPDFLVKFNSSNKKTLLEVKPKSLLEDETNKLKILAGYNYCYINELEFDVWTESEINKLEQKYII